MLIGILQPSYIPWLGFFEQISRVDVFVLYDDVQYDKQGRITLPEPLKDYAKINNQVMLHTQLNINQ